MPIVPKRNSPESRIDITVKIWHENLVNIYDSTIGENTKVASFVEIGSAHIGRDCKIEAHAFIPPGSTIGDGVFIGPHVVLTNDKYPNAMSVTWEHKPVTVKDHARIGANSTILPGVTVGENATVGAGSVVSEDVPDGAIVYGEKAKKREVKCLNTEP